MTAGLLPALLLLAPPAAPAERVTWDAPGGPRTVVGRVLAGGADGGVLLEGPDGTVHAVAAGRVRSREPAGAFAPLSGGQLAAVLAGELGPGAATRAGGGYAIASTAPPEFTDWAADLLGAVRDGFLEEFAPPAAPAGPLPMLILKDRAAFVAHARRPEQRARGVDAALSQGYYDPVTNRVVLYDFTAGTKGPGRAARRARAAAAEANVATVAHEATHQLAYNTGLHARLANTPVWVTEGLAMQAEAADRRAPLGWRGFGSGANPNRSGQFRALLAARRRDPALRDTNPLPKLIASDALFTDPATARPAYAASWALVRHLRREQPDAFAAYLADLAALPPLVPRSPADRTALFTKHFGDDTDALWRRVKRVR